MPYSQVKVNRVVTGLLNIYELFFAKNERIIQIQQIITKKDKKNSLVCRKWRKDGTINRQIAENSGKRMSDFLKIKSEKTIKMKTNKKSSTKIKNTK